MYLGKFNVRTELKKMRDGKKTKVPVCAIAAFCLDAIPEVKVRAANDDVRFLEDLFKLEDPRK